MATDVIVPAVGESITEGVLSRWLVADGEIIAAGTPIYELETDKISTEVEAEVGGKLTHAAEEGATVEIGAVIATIDASAEAGAAEPSLTEPTPSSQPVASQTGTKIDITVPAVGESITEGVLSKWLIEDAAKWFKKAMRCLN